MQDNVMLNSNVTLKDRVYNWIEYLCTHHNINQVKDIPVMVTTNHVSLKFSISNRQSIRILNTLVEEKRIYRYKIYNKLCIYSLRPLDITHDLFVRVRP